LILLSPGWLESDWCRSEYETFVRDRELKGSRPHIVPILWKRTPALREDTEDRIARALAGVLYADGRNRDDKNWKSSKSIKLLSKIAKAVKNNIRAPERKRWSGDGTPMPAEMPPEWKRQIVAEGKRKRSSQKARPIAKRARKRSTARKKA